MTTTNYLNAPPYGLSRHLDRMARSIDRMHGPGRELLYNGAQAGAERFHVDGYVLPSGRVVMRLTDDGSGMSPGEVADYMTTMFESGPDRPDNHGMGARVSTLPFHKAGVAWASRHDGVDALIQIQDHDGAYGLTEYEIAGEGVATVVDPESVYPGVLSMLDDWDAPTGTAVLLLGTAADGGMLEATMSATDFNDLAMYTARRFWQFPGALSTITTTRRAYDPTGGYHEAHNYGTTIWPLEHVYRDITGKDGGDHGSLMLAADTVAAEWFVLPVEESGTDTKLRRVQSSAPWSQAVAGRCVEVGGEVFDFATGTRPLVDFGLYKASVAQRVFICLHIPAAMIVPNEERTAISLSGGGRLPIADWAREFAENMPEPVAELLADSPSSGRSLTEQMMDELDADWRRWIDHDGSSGTDAKSKLVAVHHGRRIVAKLPRIPGDPQRSPGVESHGGDGRTLSDRSRQPGHDRPGRRITGSVPPPELTPQFIDEDELDEYMPPSPDHYAWISGDILLIRRAIRPLVKAKAKHRHGVSVALHRAIDEVVEDAYGIELAAKIIEMRIEARRGENGYTTGGVEEHLRSPYTMSGMLSGLNAIDRTIRARLTGRSSVLRSAS